MHNYLVCGHRRLERIYWDPAEGIYRYEFCDSTGRREIA